MEKGKRKYQITQQQILNQTKNLFLIDFIFIQYTFDQERIIRSIFMYVIIKYIFKIVEGHIQFEQFNFNLISKLVDLL